MNLKLEREKISHFIKCGLFVLSVILIAGLGIYAKNRMDAKARSGGEVAGRSAIHNSGKKLPIYCVDSEEKKVALSFDAAWGNEDTADILKILKKYDVHVTFFMTGGWVSSYPDDVKAIAKAGHDLGNHSENHKQMSQLPVEECKEELMSVHEKVKELTGVEMQLFRPPYGDYNDTVIETANSCGYHVIQWDVDSLDWKDYGVDSIINTVINHKHLGNGSIILCHNGAKFTKDALPSLIEGIQKQGYTIVPISQLIYQDNYEMDHEGRQHTKGGGSSSRSATLEPSKETR